jgi:hypothetical protein
VAVEPVQVQHVPVPDEPETMVVPETVPEVTPTLTDPPVSGKRGVNLQQ